MRSTRCPRLMALRPQRLPVLGMEQAHHATGMEHRDRQPGPDDVDDAPRHLRAGPERSDERPAVDAGAASRSETRSSRPTSSTRSTTSGTVRSTRRPARPEPRRQRLFAAAAVGKDANRGFADITRPTTEAGWMRSADLADSASYPQPSWPTRRSSRPRRVVAC